MEGYHRHNNFSSQISKFSPNKKFQEGTTINMEVLLSSNFVEWKIVKSPVFLSYSLFEINTKFPRPWLKLLLWLNIVKKEIKINWYRGQHLSILKAETDWHRDRDRDRESQLGLGLSSSLVTTE